MTQRSTCIHVSRPRKCMRRSPTIRWTARCGAFMPRHQHTPFASCCAASSTNFRSSGLRLATWEKVCLSGSTGSTRSLPGSSSQQSSANPATISEIILSSRPARCSGIRSWSYLSRYSVLNASCSVSITRSHPAMLARVGSMTHRSATKTDE